jgi:group I intron endonuclease
MSLGAIYIITNIINQKIYIGSTSNHIRRKKDHFNKLRTNKHHSPHLQKSFNKYGEENFIFEILEHVENLNDLLDREQYYLDLYKSYDHTRGYNICKIAGNTTGYSHTEETKAKISKINKGRTPSEETRKKISELRKGKKHDESTKTKISMSHKNGGNSYMRGRTGSKHHASKSVVQMSLDGEFIAEYSAISEAERAIGIGAGRITKCCKGAVKRTGDYIWVYKEDYQKNTFRYDKPKYSLPIVQLDLSNKFIAKYNDIDDVVDSTGFSRAYILAACAKSRDSSCGFKWLFLEDYLEYDYPEPKCKERWKKVRQLDMNGKFVAEFECIAEASKKTGINRAGIGKCCRKEQKQAGKYKWEYT